MIVVTNDEVVTATLVDKTVWIRQRSQKRNMLNSTGATDERDVHWIVQYVISSLSKRKPSTRKEMVLEF